MNEKDHYISNNTSDFMYEKEIIEDRLIRGKPKYYTTGQVAEIIGEPDSTIRYWCDEFDEFLQIEKTGKSGRRRQFTSTDIKKIEYIRYLLKEENLSIKQVKEFLSSPEAEKMLPIAKEKEQLMIEALSNAVASQVKEEVEKMLKEAEDNLIESAKMYMKAQEDFVNRILQIQKDSANVLRANMQAERERTTQDLTELFNKERMDNAEQIMEMKTIITKHLEDREKSFSEVKNELIEQVNELKATIEKLEKEKSKGFFARFFKR